MKLTPSTARISPRFLSLNNFVSPRVSIMGRTSTWIGNPDTRSYALENARAMEKSPPGTSPRAECGNACNKEAGLNLCDKSGTVWHRICQGVRGTYYCTGCRRGAEREIPGGAAAPFFSSGRALSEASMMAAFYHGERAARLNRGGQHPATRAGHLIDRLVACGENGLPPDRL